MTSRSWALPVVLTLMAGAPLVAEPLLMAGPLFLAPEKAAIDAFFVKLAGKTGFMPGFQVVVARADTVLYELSWGKNTLVDTTNLTVAYTPSTTFNVGSVTKPITATLLAKLQEDGKLKLDDLVQKYIPEYPFDDVSLVELMTHTAGYDPTASNMVVGSWPQTKRLLPAYLKKIYSLAEHHFPVMTDSRYFSAGYTILMDVLQRVTGQTIEDYAQKVLFGPVGMTNTTFEQTKADRKNSVLPMTFADGKATPWTQLAATPPTGDSGLVSNAYDLAQFGQLLLNKGMAGGQRVLAEATVDLLLTECTDMAFFKTPAFMIKAVEGNAQYGFLPVKASPSALGHPGFSGTFLWLDPETGITASLVSASTNVGEAWMKGPRNVMQLFSDKMEELSHGNP